jgi:hypothetical protein
MNATATYSKKAEPIFSSRQDESPERGQVLRVTVYFPNGVNDFEEARLGDYGCWIPAEEITEAEELCTRTLNRRIQARLAEDARRAEGIYR